MPCRVFSQAHGFRKTPQLGGTATRSISIKKFREGAPLTVTERTPIVVHAFQLGVHKGFRPGGHVSKPVGDAVHSGWNQGDSNELCSLRARARKGQIESGRVRLGFDFRRITKWNFRGVMATNTIWRGTP